MDARIRYTLFVIQKEFLALLKEQPLDKITVKGICDKAEINRATFYRYFDNPKDLLDKMETERLVILQEKIQNVGPQELQDIFRIIMEDIMENTELYEVFFSENGDRTFRKRIYDSCYEYYISIITERFPELSEKEKIWLYYFVAEGCNGVLNRWILDGMKDPIDEVTSFTESIVIGINAVLPAFISKGNDKKIKE